MPTVPAYWNHGRKAEFTLHLGMGMAMSVNRPQAQNVVSANGSFDYLALPPFWELEELIENGLERPGALAVMAARRMKPMIAKDTSCDPAVLPAMIAFGSTAWKR